MQRDRVQAGLFGKSRQVDADNMVIIPAHAELHGEGNRHRRTHRFENLSDQWQIAQQTAPAVARYYALCRAAEVQVHHVEAGVFDNSCRIGKRCGIRPEELCRNRMLVVVKGQVALALRLPHAREAVGGSEFGHDEPAT